MDTLLVVAIVVSLAWTVAYAAGACLSEGWRLVRHQGRQFIGLAAMAAGLLFLVGGPLAIAEFVGAGRYEAEIVFPFALVGAGVGVTWALWQRRKNSRVF